MFHLTLYNKGQLSSGAQQMGIHMISPMSSYPPVVDASTPRSPGSAHASSEAGEDFSMEIDDAATGETLHHSLTSSSDPTYTSSDTQAGEDMFMEIDEEDDTLTIDIQAQRRMRLRAPPPSRARSAYFLLFHAGLRLSHTRATRARFE